MARRLKRLIVILFLLASLLGIASLASLYFFRAMLAQKAIDTFLLRQKLAGIEFSVRDIGISEFAVDSIRGCFGEPPAAMYCLKSGPATLSYSINLKGDTRMKRITAHELDVEIGKAEKKEGPITLAALKDSITFRKYLNWIDELDVSGIVSVPFASESRPVAVSLESNCSNKYCQVRFDARDTLTDYSLRGQANELANGRLTSEFTIAANNKLFSRALLERKASNSDLHIDIGLADAALKMLTPPGVLAENNPGRDEAVKVVFSVSDRGVNEGRQRASFEITVDPIKTAFVPIGSARFSGQLADDFSLAASGEIQSDLFKKPVKLSAFEYALDGSMKGSVTAAMTAVELTGAYRSISNKKLPLTVAGGSIESKYNFSVTRKLGFSAKGEFAVEGLSGTAGSTQLVDVAARLAFKHDLTSIEVQPTRVEIRQLNSGVKLDSVALELLPTNVDFRNKSSLKFDTGITSAKALIFGGTAVIAPVKYSSSKPTVKTMLTLERIDISEIVALYGKEVLRATGLIDGRLPVMYTPSAGVSVENGQLQARNPGGVIQIGESLVGTLSSTPGMDIAARALKDYRYTFLESSVTYEPDGRLLLGLELHGRSPELNTTRPVHVNLNVEQNVLKLFKSLQIVDEIERGIRK